jgi:hypothetical protein
MTETVWLTTGDLLAMLAYLGERIRAGSLAEVTYARKARLAACACCRRRWGLLTDRRSRAAIEAAERFADGELDTAALAEVEQEANFVALEAPYFLMPAALAAAVAAAQPPLDVRTVFRCYLQKAQRDAVFECGLPSEEGAAAAAASTQEMRIQCGVLREVFGNPFRPPQVEPALRRWNDGCVVRLAQRIYEERCWDDLPILCDALADAGCTDERLIAHCAAPAEHARGCWALDALLGRE